jgi:hypothetical protein
MTKFAHLADIHLGGWKQKPMQDLNFQAFRAAVNKCIESKLDFMLISGDLFDSAYPPIDILKDTFAEFRRISQAKIPCFIIAGSHDYSVSGKTFLDVLEKAGFCKNIADFEEKEDGILLNPTVYKNVAIYGYPGKKSGLEVRDLKRIKINDSPGFFKILMLHTTLDKAKGTLPIEAVEADSLPAFDYYALGHLHIDFLYQNFVYPGPVFPNNFQELEDLKCGSFYIVDTETAYLLKKIEINLKEIASFEIELKNSFEATEKIISHISNFDLNDKIVLLRIKGELENGSMSDIKFAQIENFVRQKNAYFLLKNTHELTTKELELEIEIKNSENIEEEVIQKYTLQNPSNFNSLIPELMNVLSLEKQEGETNETFETRLLEGAKKVLLF